MKRKSAIPGLTSAIASIAFTILFGITISLVANFLVSSNSSILVLSPFVYIILIITVVVSLGLSVIQFYSARSRLAIPENKEELEKSLSEIILKEQIRNELKNVVEEVEQIQGSVIDQTELEIPEGVLFNIDEILHTSSTNPRAALLLLSAKIEQQMRLNLQEADLQRETTSAFRDFLAVRNKVAHDAAFEVKDATILTLISIGVELLKIASAKKHSTP